MKAGQHWELQVENPPGDWIEQLQSLEWLERADVVDDNRFNLVFNTADPRARRELFQLCSDREVPILSLTRSELDLEEIFLELTTEPEEDREVESVGSA